MCRTLCGALWHGGIGNGGAMLRSLRVYASIAQLQRAPYYGGAHSHAYVNTVIVRYANGVNIHLIAADCIANACHHQRHSLRNDVAQCRLKVVV
jgi:hypothetical protein